MYGKIKYLFIKKRILCAAMNIYLLNIKIYINNI